MEITNKYLLQKAFTELQHEWEHTKALIDYYTGKYILVESDGAFVVSFSNENPVVLAFTEDEAYEMADLHDGEIESSSEIIDILDEDLTNIEMAMMEIQALKEALNIEFDVMH